MRNSQQKPWLNEDGSTKSDEELREISPNWGESVWEKYLSTFEVKQKEDSVLSPSIIDTFSADECAGLLFSLASEEKHLFLKVALNVCIRELPPRQREIILGYYWDGKTVNEMAASMGISTQAVYKAMRVALAKLKASLTSGSMQKRMMAAREILAS